MISAHFTMVMLMGFIKSHAVTLDKQFLVEFNIYYSEDLFHFTLFYPKLKKRRYDVIIWAESR